MKMKKESESKLRQNNDIMYQQWDLVAQSQSQVHELDAQAKKIKIK